MAMGISSVFAAAVGVEHGLLCRLASSESCATSALQADQLGREAVGPLLTLQVPTHDEYHLDGSCYREERNSPPGWVRHIYSNFHTLESLMHLLYF